MNKREAELHADMEPEEREFKQLLGEDERKCPPPALLSAASEGVLPDDLQQRITKHLAGCEMCRMLQQDLSAIEVELTPAASARIQQKISQGAAITAQPSKVVQISRARKLARWWLPAAAALAACLILAVTLWRSDHKDNTANYDHHTPTQQALNIPLEKYPLRMRPDSLLETRGNSSQGRPTPDQLVRALTQYKDGDYKKSVPALRPLVQKYPACYEAALYLGISQLFTGDNQAAIQNLAHAQSLSRPGEQGTAEWYWAIAQARMGNYDQAHNQLKSLCGSAKNFSQQACEIEKQSTPSKDSH